MTGEALILGMKSEKLTESGSHIEGGQASEMIEISPSIQIREEDLQFEYIRASGPGGQNVNKVSSAVQLRFDVRHSLNLDPEAMQRFIRLAGHRLTDDGVLVIEARRYRTQEQNREDAIQRLVILIRNALQKPHKRIPTRPGGAAKSALLRSKMKRGELKRIRQERPEDWE